jgi:hypothetical protein
MDDDHRSHLGSVGRYRKVRLNLVTSVSGDGDGVGAQVVRHVTPFGWSVKEHLDVKRSCGN